MAMEIKHLQTSEAKIDLSPQKDYFAEWQMSELKASKAEKEIRRLKHALWLARAESAKNAKYRYHRLAQKEVCDPQPHGWSCYINGEVYQTGKMTRRLEPHYWCDVWEEVERKCRAKAKEYK